MRRVIYILFQRDFFLCGYRGRVSHACGFVQGLIANHFEIEVFSGDGATAILPEQAEITEVHSPRSVWALSFFLRAIVRVYRASQEIVVIRWRPFHALLFLLFAFPRRKHVWVEINSLTGIYSGNWVFRYVAKCSIKLAARYFSCIAVSDLSAREIARLASTDRLPYIMPNGFNPGIVDGISLKVNSSKLPTLIYFGKKQSYYSWDMVFDVFKKLFSEKYVGKFVIYGFKTAPKHPGITTFREYQNRDMGRLISKHVNPILILPVDSSKYGRSGSPMKLYEYVALGAPVVFSDSLNKQTEKIAKYVFTYSADDSASLEQVLISIISNYRAAQEAANHVRSIAIAEYSWKEVVARWARTLV